jgi:hypothetical protein
MQWKLFIDDDRYPTDNTWVIARNFDDAVWYIQNYGIPYFISFDHDLGHPNNRTGLDIAKWLANYVMDNDISLPNNFNFYVHSQNPVGTDNINKYMKQFVSMVA